MPCFATIQSRSSSQRSRDSRCWVTSRIEWQALQA